MTRPDFRFEDLERALHHPPRVTLAELLGIQHRQLYRLIRRGLDELQADELAVRCGLHPAEVWPHW